MKKREFSVTDKEMQSYIAESEFGLTSEEETDAYDAGEDLKDEYIIVMVEEGMPVVQQDPMTDADLEVKGYKKIDTIEEGDAAITIFKTEDGKVALGFPV